MDGLTFAGSQADLVSPPSHSQADTVQQFLAQPRCRSFAEPSRHSCTPAILHQALREKVGAQWLCSSCQGVFHQPVRKMSLTAQLCLSDVM